jgi:alginate O-acetyltransferase complex protein AlgI
LLFNSFEFLFFFLPATIFLYFYSANKWGNNFAIGILVFCSLIFYGWWNPLYLPLLLFSIGFNFSLGKHLSQGSHHQHRMILLISGIIVNLGLLGYFKYANFFVENIEHLVNQGWKIEHIILPLAISFFTFQQIGYLVDSYRRITHEYNFLHYCLFVSFFPQLIAGPIVHHKEILPQFSTKKIFRISGHNVAIGLSIFAIGLFKKTVIADGVAPYANLLFDSSTNPDFILAWLGALAYTLQLYFDFSGYSDMAIGLARIFGIILPLNFYSPYKARSITEFWRRWHITLSTFLRDYVYIALGGNRKGETQTYLNLFITLFLGGIWHGAGWTFIIWGSLHGSYLVANHLWVRLSNYPLFSWLKPAVNFLGWPITFICVVISWVFFRASDPISALNILNSMIGNNGVAIPNAIFVRLGPFQDWLNLLGIETYFGLGTHFIQNTLWVTCLLPMVILLPNTHDLFSRKETSALSQFSWTRDQAYWPLFKWMQRNFYFTLSHGWSIIIALSLSLSILTLLQVSEFLYFQF